MKKMSKVVMAVLLIGSAVVFNKASVAEAQEEVIDLQKIVVTDKSEQFYRTQAVSVKKYNCMLEKITVNNGAKGSNREYDEVYGGSYINENGELVVLLTDNVYKNRKMIREYTEDENTIIRTCQYSYNELMKIIGTINEKLQYLLEQGIIIDEMYDDVYLNRVIFRIRDLDDEKEQVIRDIIDSGCMEFRNSERGAVLEETLRGGIGITSSDNGKTSTLGFCATRNGVEGYVVAGHSADRIGEKFTYNGTVIGEVTHTAYYQNTTADAGFIKASSSGTLSNYIMGYKCISATGYEYPYGTRISMYGQASGLKSGMIYSYHSSFNESGLYGTYTTIDHVKADYSSQGGDSGAPVFLYEGNYNGVSLCTLLGIHSADIGEGYVQFAKYSNIVKELGITAVVE